MYGIFLLATLNVRHWPGRISLCADFLIYGVWISQARLVLSHSFKLARHDTSLHHHEPQAGAHVSVRGEPMSSLITPLMPFLSSISSQYNFTGTTPAQLWAKNIQSSCSRAMLIPSRSHIHLCPIGNITQSRCPNLPGWLHKTGQWRTLYDICVILLISFQPLDRYRIFRHFCIFPQPFGGPSPMASTCAVLDSWAICTIRQLYVYRKSTLLYVWQLLQSWVDIFDCVLSIQIWIPSMYHKRHREIHPDILARPTLGPLSTICAARRHDSVMRNKTVTGRWVRPGTLTT